MKQIFTKMTLVAAVLAFSVSALQAKWVMVDPSDGAQLVCCTKARVVHKRVIKKKMTPCDEIPTAKTLPLEPGEKLAPANLKRCISCDLKYGVIK